MVDGSIACTNDAFGMDPKAGVAKHCICSHAPYEQKMGLGKVKVHEGEEIDCVGTVFYGHTTDGMFNKIFEQGKTYGKKRSYGKTSCSFEEFGDVAPGKGKGCWCEKDSEADPYEVQEGFVVEKCGKEGEECNCTTTIHYGDAAAKDFSEMSKTFFKSKDMSPAAAKKGFLDCSNHNMGGDPLPNKPKQCFCERPEKPEKLKEKSLTKCGSEGEKCACKGRVFYGKETDNKTLAGYAKEGKPSEHLTPADMFKFPWAQREVFGEVDCSDEVFGNVLRNGTKQCFCEPEIEGPTIEKCGSEGDECVCLGRVFYGREKVGQHSPISFDDMIRKPHKVQNSHGSIQCNNAVFGDPSPGKAKQCFCESGLPITKKVLKCSDEGESCMCKGNIFYGAAVVKEEASDFEKMLTLPFKVRPSNDESAITCDNAHFGDPLPGAPKACFCDDIGKMSRNQINSQQSLAIAELNTKKAEEAAKELEKQTKDREAEIEKMRKKHFDDMEKQAKKNKDALEALIKADKEAADKQKAESLALETAEKSKAKDLDK